MPLLLLLRLDLTILPFQPTRPTPPLSNVQQVSCPAAFAVACPVAFAVLFALQNERRGVPGGDI